MPYYNATTGDREGTYSNRIELFGLDEWKVGEWNDFYTEYTLRDAHDALPNDVYPLVGSSDNDKNSERSIPFIVRGGVKNEDDGRYIVVDDVVVLVIDTPNAPIFGSCIGLNLAENGDAEQGTAYPFKDLGDGIAVTTDAYSGTYAFKTGSFNSKSEGLYRLVSFFSFHSWAIARQTRKTILTEIPI